MSAPRLKRLAIPLTFLGGLGLVVGLMVTVSPAVSAATTESITQSAVVPLDTTYLDMAVDPSTNDLFVTTQDSLMKLNPDGTPIATVPLERAMGMVFAAGTLWMGLVDSNEVVAMDPNTLQVIASYSVPYPRALAADDGAIWVDSDTNDSEVTTDLVKIDPASGAVTDTLVTLPGENIEANPARPDQLLSWSIGTPFRLELISIAGDSPTVLTSETCIQNEACNPYASPATIGFLPDGSGFIPMAGSPYQLETFNSQSLRPDGTVYNTSGQGSIGGEVSSADGGVVVGEGLNSAYIYALNSGSTPIVTARYTNTAVSVPNEEVGDRMSQWDGVALSNDGTHLYLVVANPIALSSYELDVFDLSGSIATSPVTTTPDDGFVAPPAAQAPTTSVLYSSPDPSSLDEPVNFTDTVTPAPADGTVSFSANGMAIPGCGYIPVIAGGASCRTTEFVVPENNLIVANYSGGADLSSSFAELWQEVDTTVPPQVSGAQPASTTTPPAAPPIAPARAATAPVSAKPVTASIGASSSALRSGVVKHVARMAIKSTPGSLRQNKSFTLGIHLTGTVGIPQGRILVRVAGHRICSTGLTKSGSASCRVQSLRAGTYRVVIAFSSSSRYVAIARSEKLLIRR